MIAGGLPVPVALTRGVSLRVIDYAEAELTLTAGAGGVATERTPYLPQGQWWRVERIIVQGDSASDCEVAIYKGDEVLPQRARDWTPLPPGFIAIAEYPAYLNVYPASCLTVDISGASPGDTFSAAVQYQLVAKITG